MSIFRAWYRRVVDAFATSRHDRDFAEEMAQHLEMHIGDNVKAGSPPDVARREALLKLGGVQAAKERQRDRRGLPWLDALAQDVRYGTRRLRHSPVFTGVAVVTLAIGIGANTTIFSLLNSLALRQLPVREPRRLVALSDTPDAPAEWTYAIWDQMRQHGELFDGAFAYSFRRFNLSSGGQVDPVRGMYASGQFFTTLGVSALVGRTFGDGDDTRDGGPAGPVAVINHAFWQARFGGALDTVGRVLMVEGVPFTIIGVTPPEFFGPEVGRSFDLIVPLETEPLVQKEDTAFKYPTVFWLTLLARLKAGEEVESTVGRLRSVQGQVRRSTMPPSNMWRGDDYLSRPFTLLSAEYGNSSLRRQYERPLRLVLAGGAVLLLIVCINIANLMLARSTSRRFEIGVRVALGASRRRVVRQLLTESLLLAAVGACAGAVFAAWSSGFVVRQLSTQANTVFLSLGPDWRVLALTAGLAVITAALFGTFPAFRSSRTGTHDVLRMHRLTNRPHRTGFSSTLVVFQMAFSLVLVVAAGLFGRTFAYLATRDLGFDRSGLLVVNVDARRTNIQPADRLDLFERVSQAVRLVPGVTDVATSQVTPVGSVSGTMGPIDVTGGTALPDEERRPFVNWVSPHWFSTYRVPVLAGRDFTERDRGGALSVVVVNKAFARKFQHGASPIGQRVRWGGPGFPYGLVDAEIIGLVGDAAYRSVRDESAATMYMPVAQSRDRASSTSIFLSVRPESGQPLLLASGVTSAVTRVNPNLSLTFRPIAEQVRASFMRESLLALLSGFFGAVALLLTALGLYGVTFYVVSVRKMEMAIRTALGAAPGLVMWMVLRRIAGLLAIGIACGTLLSWWASRFMSATLLYGVQPRDPVMVVVPMIVLVMVGGLAAWQPAYRASRVDPGTVLREA